MSDIRNLIQAVDNIQKAIEQGCEDGLRAAGVQVAGTAKEKFGQYQPAVGEYPAWAPLKPESIRQKFLSNSKKFHISDSGKVRINMKRAGQKYLEKYGRNAKVFGAGKQFQTSGTSDDGPLVATGHLRAAIRTDDSDVSNGYIYIGVAGKGGKSSVADYAVAHEFGSAKQNIPPRPYLRPSVVENKDVIEEEIKRAIAQAITGLE